MVLYLLRHILYLGKEFLCTLVVYSGPPIQTFYPTGNKKLFLPKYNFIYQTTDSKNIKSFGRGNQAICTGANELK